MEILAKKDSSPLKVVLAAVGICSFYMISSVCEEALYSFESTYGKKFRSPLFYLFITCFINCIVAAIGIKLFGRSSKRPSFLQCITIGFW
jgi:hypothetical protein